MRRDDQIPGIIYGAGEENEPVFLSERQIIRTFNNYGSRGLFSLEIDGDNPRMALIRDLQKNPLNEQIMHIDFLVVKMDEKINSSVFIHIIGEEEVNKKGGILQIGAKELEVFCLPQNLPDYITCDVSNLQIGDKITIGDLEIDENIEIIGEPDLLIASILVPAKSSEELEEEAAEEKETEAAEENE
jgi:large subunit ribosomal protein L25